MGKGLIRFPSGSPLPLVQELVVGNLGLQGAATAQPWASQSKGMWHFPVPVWLSWEGKGQSAERGQRQTHTHRKWWGEWGVERETEREREREKRNEGENTGQTERKNGKDREVDRNTGERD